MLVYDVYCTTYIVRRILCIHYTTYSVRRTLYVVYCNGVYAVHILCTAYYIIGMLNEECTSYFVRHIIRTNPNVSRTFDVHYRDRIESYKGKLGRDLYWFILTSQHATNRYLYSIPEIYLCMCMYACYIALFALYVLCTLCNVHCTLYSLHYVILSLSINVLHNKLRIVHYVNDSNLCTVRCIVYSVCSTQ